MQELSGEESQELAPTAVHPQESDYGDSLLGEVAGAQPLLPLPVPGERLGGASGRRFEIQQSLGGGAMGEVYRAWDGELQRVVALKFLLPRTVQLESGASELLKQEARAIARLDHPQIVRLFDVSEWNAEPWGPRVPFLVMEYLQGESLAVLLRRGRLPLARAVEVMEGVAAGLAHAHQRHLVHRDLKPGNVLLTREGEVKLLDFGLAHLVASASSLPQLPTAGTPQYMAPEQWRGEPQDERTDVWAAGVLLFELLSGERPYAGLALEELRARVCSPEPMPSVRELCPELPWELEPLLASALAKEPGQRFTSAQELLEELHELARHLGLRRAPARPVAPERRPVTLLHCIPTGLPGWLDPEDLDELEAAFHQGCAEIIQRHGGTTTLSLGARVLACFGYPHAHEEDSVQAVCAALSLAEQLPRQLAQRLRHLLPGGLEVQVGLHTDMVALHEGPAAGGGTLTLRGEAPEVVYWLATRAGPGQVLLSAATSARVRGAFELETLGQWVPEGVAATRPVQVYRVLRERRAELRFTRTHVALELTPLVGREQELRELLSAWEEAKQGRGAAVVLCGEPGIGKSRLVHELRLRVGEEAECRLQAQCGAQYTASAFYPVVELLQRLLREVLPEGLSPPALGWLEPRLRALGLSTEQEQALASLLSLPPVENLPLLQITPQRQKELVLEGLATLVQRLARECPVLAVVEDLHWADPSTLELVSQLVGRIRGERVLLLLSTRPELRYAPLQQPGVHTLKLERLGAEETEALLRESAQGRPLPQELVQRLVARTDGVPLFVEEVMHMVLEREAAGAVPAAIPGTLQELLLARLDMLPLRQKALAQLCAVVGRSFARGLLEVLAEQPPAVLARDTEGLVAAGLLEREEGGAGYQFRHALLQEVAYQSLLRGTRREYHRRTAQALAEHFPEVAEGGPELLAHHYTEAGMHLQAIAWWSKAGVRASLHSANKEAIGHLSRALELLRGLPDAGQRRGEELQLLVTLGIPLVQVQGYHAPEVERTYARIRELFSEVGEVLPRLELSYWGPFAYHVARAELGPAQELAEQLVELGERQRHRELLTLGHRMSAGVAHTRGQLLAAREHIESALRYAHFTPEEHQVLARRHFLDPEVEALAFGSVIFSVSGELSRARQYGQQALELAGRIGHTHSSAFALHYVALGCQYRREAARALELSERCQALSSEHRFRLWQVWSQLVHSWALAELGQAELGLSLMQQGLALWEASGIRAGLYHHNQGMLAEVYLRLGQPRQALEVVERALAYRGEERFYDSVLHRLRGECLEALGHAQQAHESFLQAVEVARAQGARTFERFARERLG
jgi:tetratricopeptide (TPR) repeat protein